MNKIRQLFLRFKNSVIAVLQPKPIEKSLDFFKSCLWIVFAIACPTIFVVCNLTGMFWINLATGSLAVFIIPATKASWKYIVCGYKVGDEIKTTNITVTHEYGSTYKATSTTESKGCLFAIIVWFLCMWPWSALFAITGPLLPIIKIVKMIKVLVKYVQSVKN